MNKLNIKYTFIILFLCHLKSQSLNVKAKIENNSQSLKRVYTSDVSGNLFMNINIWGMETSGGRIKVPEGIDMVELLSIIGGPDQGSNYKKIIIIRENPNENNKRKITIDITQFLKNGDRSYMAKILPNDTVIINKKLGYLIIDRLSVYSSLLSIITIISTLISLIL